jgi:hypothetical protein
MLLESSEARCKEVCDYLTKAASNGSAVAQYLLWENKYKYSAHWVSTDCTVFTVGKQIQIQCTLG